MIMQPLRDLCRSISEYRWKTLGFAFTAFSVSFTIIKMITHFFPSVRIDGPFPLAIISLVGVIYALKKIWKPSKVTVKIANTNSIIEILFGDIFEVDGIRVIAVTEYFDSNIGKPVSDKSLHGIFLMKCFGGHPESFDKQVEEQLRGIEGKSISKIEGKSTSYPIGTNALISVNQDRYLVFGFAKADPETCKAYSDIAMMWTALQKLWYRARNESSGYPVNLPLVGSGLSGLGLPDRDLLNLIILSIITETKLKQVTHKFRIVLHPDRFENFDLRKVKEDWEK